MYSSVQLRQTFALHSRTTRHIYSPLTDPRFSCTLQLYVTNHLPRTNLRDTTCEDKICEFFSSARIPEIHPNITSQRSRCYVLTVQIFRSSTYSQCKNGTKTPKVLQYRRDYQLCRRYPPQCQVLEWHNCVPGLFASTDLLLAIFLQDAQQILWICRGC